MNAFRILLLALYCIYIHCTSRHLGTAATVFQCFSGLCKKCNSNMRQACLKINPFRSNHEMIRMIRTYTVDTPQKKSSSIHRDVSSPPSFFTLLLYIFSLIHSGFQVISGLDDGGSAKASGSQKAWWKTHWQDAEMGGWCCGFSHSQMCL